MRAKKRTKKKPKGIGPESVLSNEQGLGSALERKKKWPEDTLSDV